MTSGLNDQLQSYFLSTTLQDTLSLKYTSLFLQDVSAIPSIEYIPPPPAPAAEPVVEHVLNKLGEPTFVSLDLAHWTPPGFVQSALEHLHVDLGLPWWGAIVTGQ